MAAEKCLWGHMSVTPKGLLLGKQMALSTNYLVGFDRTCIILPRINDPAWRM
jgi:hypothetical protein